MKHSKSIQQVYQKLFMLSIRIATNNKTRVPIPLRINT